MSKGWENFEVHCFEEKSLHCFEEKVGGKTYTKGDSGEAFIMLKKPYMVMNTMLLEI